jgi:S1-C subfamily serine protease
MSVLENLSNELAKTVETVSPAIVRVDGRRRFPATGIVWSAEGVIVTSHHVVERDEELYVGLANGDVVEATLIGRDPNTDIAVMQINVDELAAPTWVDMDDLKVGHLALALGRPGSEVQATLGIVSAIGQIKHHRHRGHGRHRGGSRHGRGRHEGHAPHPRTSLDYYIQTDVVMYPGFSGGPLVDATGQVRGLNTSIMRGTSLTIPTRSMRRVTEMLLQHGRVRRGYLGITSQLVGLPDNLQEELEQETGLLIIAVESDSPANSSGLVLGDTVVSLDGEAITELNDLLQLLSGDRVGTAVPVQIVRGGKLVEIQVNIGERP